MIYQSLPALLRNSKSALGKGAVAVILLEDDIEAESTIRHHLDSGFGAVVVFGAADIALSDDILDQIVRVHFDMLADAAMETAVNAVIKAVPGRWVYYGYGAEYLFFPFCEHRTIGEMLAFASEERRDSVLTYVVDLYAGDLSVHPNAVSLDDAHLDKSGYYALARKDNRGAIQERQLDFFGGLRWRYEEHVPHDRRRIDRVGLFRAKPGLMLSADHRLNDAEYNTYACPWHHSMTATICSFRTAKALKRNPGSGYQIDSFQWRNSTPFAWHSQQLMDLGLMEPGQWF